MLRFSSVSSVTAPSAPSLTLKVNFAWRCSSSAICACGARGQLRRAHRGIRPLQSGQEDAERHAEEEGIVHVAARLVAGGAGVGERPAHAAEVDRADAEFLRQLVAEDFGSGGEREEQRVGAEADDLLPQIVFDQVEFRRVIAPVVAHLVKMQLGVRRQNLRGDRAVFRSLRHSSRRRPASAPAMRQRCRARYPRIS